MPIAARNAAGFRVVSVLRPRLNCARGAAALEFVLVAPVLIILIFGSACYGALFGIYHSVQQLAAESARASVAGLDERERLDIVSRFIAEHTRDYAFVEPERVTVEARTSDSNIGVFEVIVSYDASAHFMYSFADIIPLPPPVIVRRSAVVHGG